MLITKEQQEALVSNYVKQGHNQDECIGFIDGVEKTMELISKLNNKNLISDKREILVDFKSYWKNSSHQNIDDAMKGYLKKINKK